MRENKSVGPNLRTYYYYTNETAHSNDAKGIIVIATGIEATGKVYDEIGDYLDTRGYALYAIDELGYGKTGKVNEKKIYKNWKKKDAHFAAYNVHALSVLAKNMHPDAPLYLIGNDFGAMLSLYLIREFPEIIDKVVTIGWGLPRGQDYGFYLTSLFKKMWLYDDGKSKLSHLSKNKRFGFRFERHEKYAWLSSDLEQVKKIKDAGFIDTIGTVGHYYYYYKSKIRIPLFMRMKKTDKNTPMLMLSGDHDLFTLRGRKTKQLARYYKFRKFTNVTSMIVPGRHELLFEKNRFDNMELILKWLENEKVKEESNEVVIEDKYKDIEIVGQNISKTQKEENVKKEENVVDVQIEKVPVTFNELQEAEDELLIRTHKDSE